MYHPTRRSEWICGIILLLIMAGLLCYGARVFAEHQEQRIVEMW